MEETRGCAENGASRHDVPTGEVGDTGFEPVTSTV